MNASAAIQVLPRAEDPGKATAELLPLARKLVEHDG